MPKLDPNGHLLLVDVETTGLVARDEKLLEVGFMVVDLGFRPVASFSEVISQEGADFDPDDLTDFIKNMHTKNGLLHTIETADLPTLDEVEEELTEWYDDLFGDAQVPLVGSSVSLDRDFIVEHFVDFPDRLHYRIIDWSSVKELCRRYNPEVYAKLPPKREKHRVMPDLEDTVAEARFYVENFFFTTRP